MAKIRLSTEKREALRRLAATKLQDSPLPAELMQQLSQARKAMVAAYKPYNAAVLKAMKEAYPPHLIRTYNKLGHAALVKSITVVSQDGTEFQRAALPGIEGQSTIGGITAARLAFAASKGVLSSDVNHSEWSAYHAGLSAKLFWFTPAAASRRYNLKTGVREDIRDGQDNRYIDKKNTLMPLIMALKDACEGMQAAEQVVVQQHWELRRSYCALIDGARTLEDVSAIWPEAEELRDEFIVQSQLPTLMSAEAAALIAQDVAARK